MLTRPSSLNGKGTKSTNSSACIRAAGIGSTCIKDPYARDIGARNFCIDSTSAKSACVVSVCVGSTIVIEYSKMRLQ